MKKILTFITIAALCVMLTACGEQKAYDEACELFEQGDYAAAIEMFEALGDYSDCAERIRIAKTRLAQSERREAETAAEEERALIYADAFTFLEQGDIQRAYESFSALGEYKDAREQLGRFTVLENVLTGEEFHEIAPDGTDTLRGSAVYSYGADGKAVSRSGYCKLPQYGWFENFNLTYSYNEYGGVSHIDAANASGTMTFTVDYSYNENGRVSEERYADSYGTSHDFVYTYEYVEAGEGTEAYTAVTMSEIVNDLPWEIDSWQSSYCEFGECSRRSASATTIYSYGSSGKLESSVSTAADGSQSVTNYSYGTVYLYTPAE